MIFQSFHKLAICHHNIDKYLLLSLGSSNSDNIHDSEYSQSVIIGFLILNKSKLKSQDHDILVENSNLLEFIFHQLGVHTVVKLSSGTEI